MARRTVSPSNSTSTSSTRRILARPMPGVGSRA
jgi:hypothetical protein